MPKEVAKKKKSSSAANRHQPLGQVIVDAENAAKYVSRSSISVGGKKGTDDMSDDDDGDAKDEFLDKKASTRILQLGKEQVEEEEAARFAKPGDGKRDMRRAKEAAKPKPMQGKSPQSAAKKGGGGGGDSDDDDDEEEEEEEDDDEEGGDEDSSGFPLFRTVRGADGYVDVEGAGVSQEEEAVVSTLMGAGSVPRKTLADVIMAKIAAKEQGIKEEREQMKEGDNDDDDNEEGEGEEMPMFPQKVIDVYTEIGTVLQRYTAGKLPKAFKVIPSLKQWEDVLYLTRPDQWSPQAMYQATRIFASNLNPRMAQRFFNLVLLDAVRADIHRHKKLNYHYYACLKKALYKPAAFFKGVLLPLSRDDCTLREAAIVSSVLSKCSIPVSHAAVALHKLASASASYSGGSAVFIKALLDKKYSLPIPVVCALVDYFCRGAEGGEEKRPGLAQAIGKEQDSMPVLWHQALLVFAQRYKDAIRPDEKERLKIACRVHVHHQITKEVRRELFGAKGWKNDFGGEGADGMEM